MTRTRGVALLWVLLFIGLSIGLAAATLAISRMTVTTSAVSLERADGLFYAEAAAELAVSHVRQNSDLHGNLRTGASTRLSGNLPSTEASQLGQNVRFEADLSSFNTTGNQARSLLVRVWPPEALRPFTARATLRRDLSVAEWFVLDHDPGSSWRAGQHDLPSLRSCSASRTRILPSALGGRTTFGVSWVLAGNSAAPDEVRVTWDDPVSGYQEATAPAGATSVAVSAPVLRAVLSPPPERITYLVEAIFENRLVDACTVDVMTGGSFFRVSPTRVCGANDTVQVNWDVNSDSGVQLRRIVGSSTTVLSSSSVGSLSVPIPAGGSARIELVRPAGLGGVERQTITRGC